MADEYSAKHWQDRADEACALGDDVRDPSRKESMEQNARTFERLAKQAAQREAKSLN